ncbi:MAG TPA: energy transducer TonB [Luteimonas sp.]|nr:energy transducer TonB [Luteimonas sp.]
MRTACAVFAVLMCIGTANARNVTWKGEENFGSRTMWAVQDASVLPAPPGSADAVSGCMAIGHHVLSDGSAAGLRILQGAFTAGLDDASKDAWQAEAAKAVQRWRFRYLGDGRPRSGYRVDVVGFLPASDGGERRVVTGLDAQDPRVRAACDIGTLWDWGSRNAVPVGDARAREDQRLRIQAEDEPISYWTVVEEMTPPRYPEEAIRTAVEGCIVVGFSIDVDGSPHDFRIMASSLNGVIGTMRKQMEDAALSAALQWRWAPGPDNLMRYPAFLQVPVDFHLDRGNTIVCRPVDLRTGTEQAAS